MLALSQHHGNKVPAKYFGSPERLKRKLGTSAYSSDKASVVFLVETLLGLVQGAAPNLRSGKAPATLGQHHRRTPALFSALRDDVGQHHHLDPTTSGLASLRPISVGPLDNERAARRQCVRRRSDLRARSVRPGCSNIARGIPISSMCRFADGCPMRDIPGLYVRHGLRRGRSAVLPNAPHGLALDGAGN